MKFFTVEVSQTPFDNHSSRIPASGVRRPRITLATEPSPLANTLSVIHKNIPKDEEKKQKAKFTLEQSMKAQMVGRDTALLFL